jgi:GNAT superfamily N-acetyltransferase
MRSPAELARQEERRQAVGVSDIALEAVPVGGGFMCYTAPGSWSNYAVGLGFDGPVTDEDLERLLDFYRSRDCAAVIEVAPYTDPTLLRGLQARGFTLREFENVLGRPLDGEAAPHPHSTPAGLTVEVVDEANPQELEEWVSVSTLGFRPMDEPFAPHFHDITLRLAQHPRTTCHVARIEGEVVGGCAVEVFEDFGALFGTSVHPDHRRRGVQLALMLERLAFLERAGARFATIGSAPGIPTERNAARIGFRPMYTKAVLERPS